MISVVIAGDFSPLNRVESMMERGQYPISAIGDFKTQEELFLLNFETVIANDESSKISKVGPHLKCTDKVVAYLRDAGVTAVTLANNHTMDYGEKALASTTELLESNGIKYVGAGKNLEEARNILYLEQNNEILAIINCCEHEFSYAEINKAGTNPLNPVQQYYSIQEAKTKADYVVVIVHGGHEFFDLPSLRMQETYRFFIDAGADAVINHHQHCYSGYEYYNGKPIYYGIGNFNFDWPGRKTSFYTGYVVRLKLGETIKAEELPYTQCLNEPIIELKELDGFRDDLMHKNEIIKDPEKLSQAVENYYESMIKSCEGVATPFSNKYLKELVKRGYLPKCISANKKILWKAYIDCESHRDVMLNYLKKN